MGCDDLVYGMVFGGEGVPIQITNRVTEAREDLEATDEQVLAVKGDEQRRPMICERGFGPSQRGEFGSFNIHLDKIRRRQLVAEPEVSRPIEADS